MQFVVRALTPDNRIQTVRVEAANRAGARREAELQRLRPLSIDEVAGAAGTRRGARFSVLEFSQELIALLDAGLSIVEALEGLLEKEASPEGQAVYEGLLGKLRDGQRLSTALRALPAVFPPLFVGLVQAAEGTSDLPQSLSRYVEYQSRLDTVRGRIVSASIYPAVLLLVGGGVCLFLMGYVVPRFAVVYQGSGRSLPWMSQLLLSWGQWVGAHAGAAAIGAASAVLAAFFSLRHAWRSGRLLAAFSRVPRVGENVRVMELSRLYLTLGMLLEGGIAIVPALEMAAAASLPSTRAALAGVATSVSAGGKLSEAFEAHALATPIALRMLRVGERSGCLGVMLTRAALFYEAQTARWIERFTRLFEPLLMAAIGIVIGLIVVLLYMPIFELAGSLG
jgi:general secretion pathway protein F